jgi:hypothetical protein
MDGGFTICYMLLLRKCTCAATLTSDATHTQFHAHLLGAEKGRKRRSIVVVSLDVMMLCIKLQTSYTMQVLQPVIVDCDTRHPAIGAGPRVYSRADKSALWTLAARCCYWAKTASRCTRRRF